MPRLKKPQNDPQTPPDSAESAPRAQALSDPSLDEYVRRNVLKALLALLSLFLLMVAAGRWFAPELEATTRWVHETLGLPGVLGILFVSDSITSPLPPDALLVVVAKTALAEDWIWVVFTMGVVSCIAGNIGWWVGHLGSRYFARESLRRFRRKHERRVRLYGRWAVALGALTPVPFSVTCITAGALHVPFKLFWPMTLLRIPRFYIFYIPLMYADHMPSLF